MYSWTGICIADGVGGVVRIGHMRIIPQVAATPPKLKYHAEGGTIKEFRRLRSWTWFLMNAHDI